MFGWNTKKEALQALSIEVKTKNFKLIKQEDLGSVLKYLAKQDERYEIDKKYVKRRVRVDQRQFKTAQDDSTIVYSTPLDTNNDLPFVLSFKLLEGKLAPSPIEIKFPV
jgi:hypothetical protein